MSERLTPARWNISRWLWRKYTSWKKNPPQQQHLDTKYIEKKIENSFVSHFGFRYLKSNLVCVTLKWIKKTKKNSSRIRWKKHGHELFLTQEPWTYFKAKPRLQNSLKYKGRPPPELWHKPSPPSIGQIRYYTTAGGASTFLKKQKNKTESQCHCLDLVEKQ